MLSRKNILGFTLGLVLSLGLCRFVHEKYSSQLQYLNTNDMHNEMSSYINIKTQLPRKYYNNCDILPKAMSGFGSAYQLCHQAGGIFNTSVGGSNGIYFGGKFYDKNNKPISNKQYDFLALLDPKFSSGVQIIYGEQKDIVTYLTYFRDTIAGIQITYPSGKESLQDRINVQTIMPKEKLTFTKTTIQEPFDSTNFLKECNVKLDKAPIIDINSTPKFCSQQHLTGAIPDGLGGAINTYIISDGTIYDLMSTDERNSCRYGGTLSNPRKRLRTPESLKTDPNVTVLRRIKKNYLTYYGQMYAWLLVSPFLEKDSDQYNYIDGYLHSLDEYPLFVLDDVIYNPRDKAVGTKRPEKSELEKLKQEAIDNESLPDSHPHNTYKGPRIFVKKNSKGKIVVARQEQVKVQYNKQGKPTLPLGAESRYGVDYILNTCTLQ